MRTWMKLSGLGILMTVLMTGNAYAGHWEQDTARPDWADGISNWRWINDDGTFPESTWVWLDGNEDGTAERYYFTPLSENGGGYMMADALAPINNIAAIPAQDDTGHGNQVNAHGAWVVDEVVQTVQVPVVGEETQTAEITCQVREDVPYDLRGMKLEEVKKRYPDAAFSQTGYSVGADGTMICKHQFEHDGMEITLEVMGGQVVSLSLPWRQIIGGLPATCSGPEFLNILEQAGFKPVEGEETLTWNYRGAVFARPEFHSRKQYDYMEMARIS